LHSVRQIGVVRALAKRRHFGLAAKQLGVSEPALSRSLKQLEAELGVRLFDRQGVTPTMFGEIVLKYGERAVTEFEELMRELALVKGLEVGELRIAAAPYPADISGQHAIGVVSDRHPNLLIQFRIADWTRVVDDVRQGAIDLGFADVSEAELDPEFDVEPIRASQAVFFCRAGHPLTRQERITFDDLLDYPLVGPSYPSRTLVDLPKMLRRFGVVDEVEKRFHPHILVETFHTARRVVLASPAIASAIPCQIEWELKEGLFTVLPVEVSWLKANYGFITKRGRTPSPAMIAFMEIVRQIEREIPP
jgi:DNA-binding transcriptional LysR family regulator